VFLRDLRHPGRGRQPGHHLLALVHPQIVHHQMNPCLLRRQFPIQLLQKGDELGLPLTAVFVSIRRGDEIIIPRGDTKLQIGDVVTTLCERESIAEVKDLLLIVK